jgi:hypothetical protein
VVGEYGVDILYPKGVNPRGHSTGAVAAWLVQSELHTFTTSCESVARHVEPSSEIVKIACSNAYTSRALVFVHLD